MAKSLSPYKGSRDFYPQAWRAQDYLFQTWARVAEAYGFERYDSSIVEPLALYQLKHQSNQEIISRQIYQFNDRANRQLALRPEMTPSVARMIAQRRQELHYPLRWYSIPNLWRYERPQRGRLREHWQLNLDIFGVSGIEAEHELLLISRDIMSAFGAKPSDYSLRINHRQLVELALEQLAIPPPQQPALLNLIDRRAKLSPSEFEAAYGQLSLSAEFGQLQQLLDITQPDKLPACLKDSPPAGQLKQLFQLLSHSGITNAQLDLSIVRGFDYYSGIVFELFDNHPANTRSILGGGRYDNLVGSLGVEPLPTAGLGMGDVTAADFLTSHQLWPDLKPKNRLYLVIMDGCYGQSLEILGQLRASGLAPIVDVSGRNLSKQINKIAQRASWLVVIGKQEIKGSKLSLKHLASGQAQQLALTELIDRIKADDD